MTLTAKDHERFFYEFSKYEIAVGGPDPHMALTGHLVREESPLERAWRIGCYLACYNVPTGIALWTAFPFERARSEPESLEPWIAEHWTGLQFRRERRAVRSSRKLAMHLASYAQWLVGLAGRDWGGNYEAAWRDADRIYGVGRYIKLKLLEALHRYCDIGVQLGDLRAQGGWSPREALCLLWPQHAAALRGGDGPEAVGVAEMCAAWTRETLAEKYGLEVDHYVLQVLLCDYKQSVVGRRQYPGRSQDSELVYWTAAMNYWQDRDRATDEGLERMLTARAELFPHECLGELVGWWTVRAPLTTVLVEHGYTWSDLLYNYAATADFADPVRR